jgi:hypothetical protein
VVGSFAEDRLWVMEAKPGAAWLASIFHWFPSSRLGTLVIGSSSFPPYQVSPYDRGRLDTNTPNP